MRPLFFTQMSLLQNRLVTVVLYICYGLRTFPGFAALYAPLVNRIAHRDLPNEGVSIPPLLCLLHLLDP